MMSKLGTEDVKKTASTDAYDLIEYKNKRESDIIYKIECRMVKTLIQAEQ